MSLPSRIGFSTLLLSISIAPITGLQFEQIPEQFRYNLKYLIKYSPGDTTPTSFILNPIENGLDEIAFGITNSSVATVLSDNTTGGTFTWIVDPAISAGNAYEMIATQSSGPMALYSTITIGSVATSDASNPSNDGQTTSAFTTSTSFPTSATQSADSSSQGLNAGAKAGIGVGTTLGVALLGFGAFLLGRKRRPKESEASHYDAAKAEMDGNGVEKYRYATEMEQPGPSELVAESAPGELSSHVDEAHKKLIRDEQAIEPKSPQELPAW